MDDVLRRLWGVGCGSGLCCAEGHVRNTFGVTTLALFALDQAKKTFFTKKQIQYTRVLQINHTCSNNLISSFMSVF